MGETRSNTNEQVLSEGEFLYSQDTTKGVTNVYTGPKVVTVTGQEYPVVFEPTTRKFKPIPLNQAVQQNILASQGQYVEVVNPSTKKDHPAENSKETAPSLLMGEKVNIAGPITFGLWPRQVAVVIEGHQLRFNEFMLLRIYDEEKAKENWGKAIIKTVSEEVQAEGVETTAKKEKKKIKAKEHSRTETGDINPEEFSVGKLFIIKGTEVSFFIPPTGVEVVKGDNGEYIRQALTLGSLQYCILQDESGDKNYQRGPQVVFPKPTQTFLTLQGEKVFRPIELNEIQGIYVKVIADYSEDGKTYKEGDDLFITGKDCPIYYPRHEHSIIRYDGADKHYATAIPSGEARYVLERTTGVVRMEKGPQMLLPNPIDEVIAKRVLSDSQCSLWYPGNDLALAYNRHLREISSPSTRKGVVSEGDLKRSLKRNRHSNSKGGDLTAVAASAMSVSNVNQNPLAMLGDQFTRGSTYTEPRTVTISTKFDGVPTIELFTGYAVMVVSKSGERRVETGPKTILLKYDESLEILTFSTGKPKNTENVVQTPYLRVHNNQVSDRVYAETKDHVNVSINVSYRVNFEADTAEAKQKWFEVDNYIKLLSDHIRSILKNRIRSHEIHTFFSESTSIIRDVLLGERAEGSREGRVFSENNMRLIDVEVLGVHIDDKKISSKLQEAQHFAVESSIEMTKEARALVVMKEKERIKRDTIDETEQTQIHATKYSIEEVARNQVVMLKQHEKKVQESEADKVLKEKEQTLINFTMDQELARAKAHEEHKFTFESKRQELKITLLEKEATAAVSRFEAAQGGFSEALVAISNSDTLTKIAEASTIQNFIGKENFSDIFKGSPLEDAFKNVLGKSSLKSLNGSSKAPGTNISQ